MKAKDIKAYREAQLAIDPICPLCGKVIELDRAALDHCHRTGLIRRPLHTWCNAVLGRVENWSKRGNWNNIEFLKNVVKYLESDHTDIIHPSHGRVRRRKKRDVTAKRKKPEQKVVRSRNKKGGVRKRTKT